MSCTICLEAFKAPVSLPCGHIFCKDCVGKAVQSQIHSSPHQKCPLCRTPFVIFNLDPAVVPNHLRPFIQPAIRNVYIESSPGASSSSQPSTPMENPQYAAQADAWRRRAESQQATMAGLVKYAQASREQAVRAEAERTALERQCNQLKRQLNEAHGPSQYHVKPEAQYPTPSSTSSTRYNNIRFPDSALPPPPPSAAFGAHLYAPVARPSSIHSSCSSTTTLVDILPEQVGVKRRRLEDGNHRMSPEPFDQGVPPRPTTPRSRQCVLSKFVGRSRPY